MTGTSTIAAGLTGAIRARARGEQKAKDNAGQNFPKEMSKRLEPNERKFEL